MIKIDHADDAIDHGVADGDQAIDRTEYNAADQLLGEIVHVLLSSGAFSGKVQSGLPQESAHLVRRADGPGSRNDASFHFLTVGTRCGNSAGQGSSRLYRGSFSPGFRRHSRDAL